MRFDFTVPTSPVDASGTRTVAATVAVSTILALLWTLTHHYKGLGGDAELYAFQALSRLHPALASDLYLQYTSQDRFTVFSPLYAAFIDRFGIEHAALVLGLGCKVLFFLASAWLARALTGRVAAAIGVALVMVAGNQYGAFEVFHYAEDWLTARSLGEALAVSAVALAVRDRPLAAALVCAAALLTHPLMALPGALALVHRALPSRWALPAVLIAILGVTVSAVVARRLAMGHGVLAILDPAWLEVVRERSKFLFPSSWTAEDWLVNVRPLLSIGLTLSMTQDRRLRGLATAAAVIGVAGVLLAVVSDRVAPLALLVQGQPWRWIWIAALLAPLIAPATAAALWRLRRVGPACAILLLGGWTSDVAMADVLLATALLLRLGQEFMSPAAVDDARPGATAPLIAVVLAVGLIGWRVHGAWPTIAAPLGAFERLHPGFAHTVRWMAVAPLALCTAAAAVLACVSWRPGGIAGLAGAAAAAFVVALPLALDGPKRVSVAFAPAALADWRAVIPQTATVLVVPSPVSPAFAWFSLQRPSYLSIDQASGVVFSADTAAEVRRRSAFVRPVWDSPWRLDTRLRRAPGASAPPSLAEFRPLTPAGLGTLCEDPALGFVVAREALGFSPRTTRGSEPWRDWKLYDCGVVRRAGRAS